MKRGDWQGLTLVRQRKAAQHAQVCVDILFQQEEEEGGAGVDDDPSPQWQPCMPRFSSKRVGKLAKTREPGQLKSVVVVNQMQVEQKNEDDEGEIGL